MSNDNEYSGTTVSNLEAAFDVITEGKKLLSTKIKRGVHKATLYTYAPWKRNSVLNHSIEVTEITGSEAVRIACNIYNFEQKHEGITVPTKFVGTVELNRWAFADISKLVSEINEAKKIIKHGARHAIPSRLERRKYYDSKVKDVISSTIYRQIPILNNVTSSHFHWCDTQKAPILLNDKEVELITSNAAPTDRETSIHQYQRLERFHSNLNSHVTNGSNLYRLMSVRIHPVHQLGVLEGMKSERKLLKLSVPVLIVRAPKGYKETPLETYVAPSWSTGDSSPQQFPDQYGKLRGLGFGIYVD
ncbi:hypothetical protein HUO09_16815 [Vibrio sp. Y2-5]|uniref:DNA replication terminus site-binding protein n=1 Tax=Vibrio sp. Y2-5 TaxID=2743977 RepID=UPI00166041C1|nr:DNA replication terminus site-binding protein [Vibrio sp. Y2-5]MBD0788017.1 hypothetical protein [Vibrio sp. Y2-5]